MFDFTKVLRELASGQVALIGGPVEVAQGSRRFSQAATSEISYYLLGITFPDSWLLQQLTLGGLGQLVESGGIPSAAFEDMTPLQVLSGVTLVAELIAREECSPKKPFIGFSIKRAYP